MPFPSPSTYPSTGIFPSSEHAPTPVEEFPIASFAEFPSAASLTDYNGIVINQNQTPVLDTDYRQLIPGTTYIQEFFLPDEYVRGSTSSEERIPSLSGFQLFLGIGEPTSASVTYTLQYQIFGIGWIDLISGAATGSHASGDRVWFDCIFDNPVEVSEELLSSRFRIKFSATGPTLNAWFSVPNPLQTKFCKAYAADGVTPLTRSGNEFSFCFRVLALTADEGIDFLGNRYRGALVQASADNASTTDSATQDKFWMSSPQPSRFAVVNQYYDVRPASKITYGLTNLIPNPSGEGVGVGTYDWEDTYTNADATTSTLWSTHGKYSLQAAGTITTNAEIYPGLFSSRNTSGFPVRPLHSYSFSIDYNAAIKPPSSDGLVYADLRFYDGTHAALFTGDITISQSGIVNGSTGTLQGSGTSPANASFGVIFLYYHCINGNGQPYSILADSVIVTQTDAPQPFFDGTFPGYKFTGQAHISPSVKVNPPTPSEQEAIIDSILIDPQTPGVYFNVYYTSEGDPATSVEEWDDKLWKRVPKTFRMTKRETHILPQPIKAKYIKIEYVQLQAKYYAPGNFAKEVAYKKHPKWVLDYFLLRNDWQQRTSQNVAGSIGVTYSSLDLAYNYYLDDLHQEPDAPVVSNAEALTPVSEFLSSSNDISDQVDSTTLAKIRLAFKPYTEHPSAFAKSDTLLGTISQSLFLDNIDLDYPLEANTLTPVDITDVSTLRREPVIFEQTFPVMFFYLTCRHKYRELTAGFSHDRAYFVGVNEIAFQRQRYTVAHDTPQYLEPGVDFYNVERNDFTPEDDGALVV